MARKTLLNHITTLKLTARKVCVWRGGGESAFLFWQFLEAVIHAATCFSTRSQRKIRFPLEYLLLLQKLL